jgi:hypothetical protein
MTGTFPCLCPQRILLKAVLHIDYITDPMSYAKVYSGLGTIWGCKVECFEVPPSDFVGSAAGIQSMLPFAQLEHDIYTIYTCGLQ